MPTKTAAKSAPKRNKTAAVEPKLKIDYPVSGEVIASNHYTFRIGARNAANVSLSIDGSDWQPCRASVGYWWFDWAVLPGRHQIKAKAEHPDGTPAATALRKFSATLGEFTKN